MLGKWELWSGVTGTGVVILLAGLGGQWTADPDKYDDQIDLTIKVGIGVIAIGVVGLVFILTASPRRWLVGRVVNRWNKFPVEIRRRKPPGYKALEIMHDKVLWRERLYRSGQTGEMFVNAVGPLCPGDGVALSIVGKDGHKYDAAQAARTITLEPRDYIDAQRPLECPKCGERYTLLEGTKQVRESLREANAILKAEGLLKNS